MTWTTTSPRSTSTHSASVSPSTPSGCTSSFLAKRTTSSAIDLTWRLEVPEATTMKSVTLLLPRTSISTMSLALSSSTAPWTASSSFSMGGGGLGNWVLMTWAWVVKGVRVSWKSAAIITAPRSWPCHGSIEAVALDVAGHGRRHQVAPGLPGGDAGADGGGRLRMQGLAQPEHLARRRLLQFTRGPCLASLQGFLQSGRQAFVAVAAGDHEMGQTEQLPPCLPGRQASEAVGAHQQRHRDGIADFRAQAAQGVDAPGTTGARKFAQVQAQAGFALESEFQHRHALGRSGTRRRAMRRIGGRHQVHRHAQGRVRGARDRQVPGMDRIESAAVKHVQRVHRDQPASRAAAGGLATA